MLKCLIYFYYFVHIVLRPDPVLSELLLKKNTEIDIKFAYVLIKSTEILLSYVYHILLRRLFSMYYKTQTEKSIQLNLLFMLCLVIFPMDSS